MVPQTGQALQGRCVTSGTSQEPPTHDGAREPQHPKLSPLEAPRRKPRRFPRKSHARALSHGRDGGLALAGKKRRTETGP